MAGFLEHAQEYTRSAVDFSHQRLVHPFITRGEAAQDREIAHERSLDVLAWITQHDTALRLTHRFFTYEDPILETKFAGVNAPNPLGLAAGFDKTAAVHPALGSLGFGFVTVGSIAKMPYPGNPRPRIFDLPESDGLINKMGFPGDGVDKAVERLDDDDPEARDYTLVVNLTASRPSFDEGKELEHFAEAAQTLLPYGESRSINARKTSPFPKLEITMKQHHNSELLKM